MTTGRWLGAAAALVLFVSVAEMFSPRAAMVLAVLTLLALFLRYPQALGQLRQLFGL